MAKARKAYDVKGFGGSGGRFRVGTLVRNDYGAPGVILRILPPYRGDEALGPRAWVAYDQRARVRQWSSDDEQRLSEASGKCYVEYTYLYMLKPVGQAKRLPRCVLTRKPNALHKRVEGRWVKAAKPPRRKTPRERREELEARLQESNRKARSSRDFPLYKGEPAKVAESYRQYAYWERRGAQGIREAIVKHKAKGALLKQWRAELAAHERRAARAERIVARLHGGPLVHEAQKATRGDMKLGIAGRRYGNARARKAHHFKMTYEPDYRVWTAVIYDSRGRSINLIRDKDSARVRRAVERWFPGLRERH